MRRFESDTRLQLLLLGQQRVEVEFYPESDWRYDFAAALKTELPKIKVVESDMTDNPFVEDQTPVRLEVPLCHLPRRFPGWTPGIRTGSDGTVKVPGEPSALPRAVQRTVEGQPVTLMMVPYGATHLRLTTLPVVSNGNLEPLR